MAEIFGRPCVIPKIQRNEPARNARKHTTKCEQQQREREREPQSNNTGDDERAKQKTNDNRRSTVNRRRSCRLRLRNAEQGEAAIKYTGCVFVRKSGLCVCGLCLVLLFAVLFERPICPFPKPLRFLRLPSLPPCVLAIVEGPFSGTPCQHICSAVSHTCCGQAVSGRLCMEEEVRSGRSESTAKEEAETLIATEQATKHAAQQKKVRSENKERSATKRRDGRTDETTTKLPKNGSTGIHALTHAISRSSPHSDHVDINHSSGRCHHCSNHPKGTTAVCTSCKQVCWDV